MMIHLPDDLESRIEAAVHDGRFASVDEAMAEAAKLLLRGIGEGPSAHPPTKTPEVGLGSIGAMREDAELLDQAVQHAMKVREERPWRSSSDE